jgi:hypothetical protein
MIKVLKKLEIEGSYLNTIIALIAKNLIANIILNGEN